MFSRYYSFSSVRWRIKNTEGQHPYSTHGCRDRRLRKNTTQNTITAKRRKASNVPCTNPSGQLNIVGEDLLAEEKCMCSCGLLKAWPSRMMVMMIVCLYRITTVLSAGGTPWLNYLNENTYLIRIKMGFHSIDMSNLCLRSNLTWSELVEKHLFHLSINIMQIH